MSDSSMPEEPTGSCSVCGRRDPYRGLVCDADRSWLAGLLGDLRILHEQLTAGEQLDHLLAAAPIPAQPTGPRGSSPPESRPPMALGPIDLTGPARQGSRAPAARGALGDDDQTGHLSVATMLETWAAEWAHLRGEHRPAPTVPALTRWLADRLDWACDEYEDIGLMADELSGYRRTLRAVLGLSDRPEYKTGVPCPTCDTLALYRRNGGEWIECGHCEALMSAAEYEQWTRDLAKPAADAA